jgi:hypothetical protein
MQTQKDMLIDVSDEIIELCDEDQRVPGIIHKNPSGVKKITPVVQN